MPQEQEHVHHSNRTRTADETHAQEMDDLAVEAATKAKKTTGVATADAAADWLDEIDEILENADTEEQAQAFVDSYVQKGGQ